MGKMFLVLNHGLTPEQERESREVLKCGELVPMPASLTELWSNVPPDAGELGGLAAEITGWLKANSGTGDYVLVEGDFGMSFMVVDWALSNGRIPVYSATKRVYHALPLPDGAVQNIHEFKHVKFRVYGRTGKPGE